MAYIISVVFQILKYIRNRAFKKFKGKGLFKNFPFLERIYDWLLRLFWPYPEIMEIQGSKMWINIKEPNFALRRTLQDYAIYKVHEPKTTELFKKIVKKGDIVIDCGANIGYFSLLACKLGAKEIYAFEPESNNYFYLNHHNTLNGYWQNLRTIQRGILNKKLLVRFLIDKKDSGAHRISSKGRNKIRTTDLDSLFNKEKVDLIKLDLEGAEALAYEGMKNIIKNNPQLKMIIEYYPKKLEQMGSDPFKFLQDLLKDFNISVIGDYGRDHWNLLCQHK